MDEERYCSVEESIIEACKEVREMRAGRLPERTLDDFMVELKQFIEDVKREDEENVNDNSNNRQIRARR